MRATSSVSASLFSPPCRLSQNFIRYLMSKIWGKKSCGARGERKEKYGTLAVTGGAKQRSLASEHWRADKLDGGQGRVHIGRQLHEEERHARIPTAPGREPSSAPRAFLTLSSSKNSDSLAGSDWQVSSFSR